MSVKLNPPFRAEHIGSLLRPQNLVEQRFAFETGTCSAAELKVVEDASIPAVVKLQREAGVQTITDGEMRRAAYYQGMFEKLGGMEVVPHRSLTTMKSYVPYVQAFHHMGLKEYSSVYCKDKIRRTHGVHTDDFKFLKSHVRSEEVKRIKVTICGPTWMHLRHGSDETYDKSVYSTDDEYFADLVAAYREEIDELYSLGCRNIQFDEPTFCFFCADSMIAGMEQAGVDHAALLDRYIRLYNDITKARPADLTVGVHMCRGNYKGMHYMAGGYERIAEKVFKNLDVDCFYLEFDDERSGDLGPLRFLPLDKVAVLGLVTSKRGDLETVEQLRRRVEEAVEALSRGEPKRSASHALNQLCLSPQCGFASVFEGNPITEEDERMKLGLVVEAATAIWA